MSSTLLRDQVAQIAKQSPEKALEKAKKIPDPWFRAQALAHVIRFTNTDPIMIAKQAAKAATECSDNYNKSAVRAWEISALAARGKVKEARSALHDATKVASLASPPSSRSEALFHLFQSAFSISVAEAEPIFQMMEESCPESEHWRCKRNLRDGRLILAGELQPRKFF